MYTYVAGIRRIYGGGIELGLGWGWGRITPPPPPHCPGLEFDPIPLYPRLPWHHVYGWVVGVALPPPCNFPFSRKNVGDYTSSVSLGLSLAALAE